MGISFHVYFLKRCRQGLRSVFFFHCKVEENPLRMAKEAKEEKKLKFLAL